MIAGEYIREPNRRLLAIRQFLAVFKVRQLSDQLFSQSLLPCQGKPGAHSQGALIALGHL